MLFCGFELLLLVEFCPLSKTNGNSFDIYFLREMSSKQRSAHFFLNSLTIIKLLAKGVFQSEGQRILYFHVLFCRGLPNGSRNKSLNLCDNEYLRCRI